MFAGQIAQLVEQGTENPCVGGSIPPLATTKNLGISLIDEMSQMFQLKKAPVAQPDRALDYGSRG